MDATMYIFLNRGAGMSPGKAAAQVAHAAVEAYRLSRDGVHPLPPGHQGGMGFSSFVRPEQNPVVEAWLAAGHYKKLVMLAEDEQHLLVIDRYLRDRNIRGALIVDEGLTEVRAHTATALGIPVVDKDDPDIAAIFSTFKLYRELVPILPATAADSGKARRGFRLRRRAKP